MKKTLLFTTAICCIMAVTVKAQNGAEFKNQKGNAKLNQQTKQPLPEDNDALCNVNVDKDIKLSFARDKSKDVKRAKDKDCFVYLTVTNNSKAKLIASFDVMVGKTAVDNFEHKVPIMPGSTKKLGGKITIPKGTVPTDIKLELINTDCKNNSKNVIDIGSVKAHITKAQLDDLGLL